MSVQVSVLVLVLVLGLVQVWMRATRYLKDWLLDFMEYQRNQKLELRVGK
ncbi:MAG: hypothetical protein ACRC62_24915 [Microcoleus sp.]